MTFYVVQDSRLVPGAGATEIELAKRITSYGEVNEHWPSQVVTKQKKSSVLHSLMVRDIHFHDTSLEGIDNGLVDADVSRAGTVRHCEIRGGVRGSAAGAG